MKNLIFSIFMIATTIMMAACSKTYSDVGGERNLVQITAKVGDISTRATQELGFQDGDSIMFYVTYNNNLQDGEIVYGVYHDQMVITDIHAPYGNQVMDIIAFYPYNAVSLDNGEFMGLVQNTYFNYEPNSEIRDLLISRQPGLLYSDTAISMTFNHAMSVLKFNIADGSQYVNKISILGNTPFKYSLSGEYLGTYDSHDTIPIENLCLIPAQNISGILVDLSDGAGTLYANLGINTEPGKITTVNLSVTPSKVNIYGATILPWYEGVLYDKEITL